MPHNTSTLRVAYSGVILICASYFSKPGIITWSVGYSITYMSSGLETVYSWLRTLLTVQFSVTVLRPWTVGQDTHIGYTLFYARRAYVDGWKAIDVYCVLCMLDCS